MEKRTNFTPGQVWLDTDGNRIQAHGGSILYADYVWLPIFFENGRSVIRWLDEWRVEDF